MKSLFFSLILCFASAAFATTKEEVQQKTSEAASAAQIQSLEKRQEELKNDLARLKTSSDKAWVEVKSGVTKAWEALSHSFAKAKEQFKEEKQ